MLFILSKQTFQVSPISSHNRPRRWSIAPSMTWCCRPDHAALRRRYSNVEYGLCATKHAPVWCPRLYNQLDSYRDYSVAGGHRSGARKCAVSHIGYLMLCCKPMP